MVSRVDCLGLNVLVRVVCFRSNPDKLSNDCSLIDLQLSYGKDSSLENSRFQKQIHLLSW